MDRKIILMPHHEIEDLEIKLLSDAIKTIYGYDFEGYAKASLKRRIKLFAAKKNHTHISECFGDIIYNPEYFKEFVNQISVNVTELFRNPKFYDFIRKNIFPSLATYPFINIWIAGCASGEEAYSIAILLHEAGLLKRTKIYATDISVRALAHGRQGIYSNDIIKLGTQNYYKAGGSSSFSDYYVSQGKKAIFNKEFRNKITFFEHNLITDRSIGEMNLILCRNVLIYFNLELQKNVIKLFQESLGYKGILGLGDKESLNYICEANAFETVSSEYKIYRKIV